MSKNVQVTQSRAPRTQEPTGDETTRKGPGFSSRDYVRAIAGEDERVSVFPPQSQKGVGKGKEGGKENQP